MQIILTNQLQQAAKEESEDDDDSDDLFGSDDEEDEEQERIKQERIAAYNERKAGSQFYLYVQFK